MSAEHYILEAEKSSELVAALRLLAETEDSGQPRFPPAACRAVAKAIVCRNYSSALHELCHLVRAASVFRGGYVDFFWAVGPVRSSRFRGVFGTGPQTPLFGVTGDGIAMSYRDKPFSVSFGRMPFLAAMMEFLITAIGFAPLDDIFAPLARPAMTAADVSAQANALSRALYDWLKEHLPPLQAQRKLGALVEFLKARRSGDFDRDAIDDQAILDFWRDAATEKELDDFRTFTSVFLAFGRLRQVIDGADSLRALDQAVPIGTSREDGEVDPHDIESFIDAVVDDANPLDALADAPAARIKFLNAKEREVCRFLFECGRMADLLPLSFVRSEVFGTAQSRITQGLRTGAKGGLLAQLIDGSCSTDYRAYRDDLAELTGHGRTVLLASAHIMHTAGIIKRPTVVPLRPKTASGPSIDNAEADAFLEEARRAAKGISRQGFRPADLDDDEVREGYVVGVPLVAKVTDRIEAFLEKLARHPLPGGDWDAQFGQDRPVFTACFQAIYGDVT